MRSSILTQKRARSLRRSMSPPEARLRSRFRRREADHPVFRRQHPVGPYILDFICVDAALAVEVDGAAHGLPDRARHDDARDRWLAGQGIEVCRVPARDVLQDVVRVAVERIEARAVRNLAPTTIGSSADGPTPPRRGGGERAA